MAVILRNGASRAARNTPSSTIPIRSSRIVVAQTGLIAEITGANNQKINAINLGYQGDNEVTQIQVKLWESAVNIDTNYEAWIVFYNESDATSKTLSLSAEGNDGEYSLLVPDIITSKAGNYKLYVVLNERTGHSEGGTGGVGEADDPAYRETFVSAGCKAVVNENSGYVLVQDFHWDNVYNYNKGVITIDDKEWVFDNNKYTTSVFLGGLDTSKKDTIKIIPPAGIEATYSFQGEVDLDAKMLILKVEIVDENVTSDELDNIIIEYPVIFNEPQLGVNFAQKTPIKVIQEPYSIAIDQNYNTTLGMKYDAYSTPIDVSGLINLPDTTSKYVIFKKGKQNPIVCKAYGNYCWIPVAITQEPGIWDVSFVGKGGKYIYYTDILKLPVVDNTLTAEDLKTDTISVAAVSSDGEKLYDKNSHAIHIIGNSDGMLSYTRDEINYAIGWVKDVNVGPNNEQFSALRVIEGIKYAEDWDDNKNNILQTISTQSATITELANSVNQNTIQIGEIANSIQDLDVTALEARVSVNEEKISTAETNISTLQSTTSSHSSELLRLAAKDVSIENKINSNSSKITLIETEVSSLKEVDRQTNQYISELRGRIDNNDADITRLDMVVDGHAAALEAHNKFGELIIKEAEDRASADTKIRIDLENEINRASNQEQELLTQITNNSNELTDFKETTNNTFELISDKLDTEIETRTDETKKLNDDVSKLTTKSENNLTQIDGLLTRTTTLEGSVIRNDVNGSSEQLVVKIVFLKSEQEYESLAVKDAGTLYLIQEEE